MRAKSPQNSARIDTLRKSKSAEIRAFRGISRKPEHKAGHLL
ncbi:hypothetical protein HMPREF9061_01245 [Actinomyces sp. oral taxon 181 str. F0379]|nr:hypothetical protein HMPREF9061_01245 [Actinomyces sp. oral taxon 181 str. F0379]